MLSNLRNFTIFLNPFSAHMVERANIAKTPTPFEVFITNYFERVMNDVIFQD
jgi:hypothetical protein